MTKHKINNITDPEMIAEISEKILKELGWEIGDNITWQDNGDSKILASLKDIEQSNLCWVLVDTISTHLVRYMVQVPKSSPEWALDIVTIDSTSENGGIEFSQEYLGKLISSHRIVSENEALELCRRANPDRATSCTDEELQKTFFTFWEKEND